MATDDIPFAARSRAEIADLVRSMTIEEKAQLVTGQGIWSTRAVERVGVPSMIVTDGPNGARGGGLMGTGTPTACIPGGAVLGSTWDVDLIRELGDLLGQESRAKGANVLLAPTINLHRHSLGGRNFECYAEDPVLSGEIAAAFVQGVQSHGVATTLKHFVANDSEFERNSIDVQVDERTLRELYLLPFEIGVKKGGSWGVMSAYNRLNGTFCSEHEWLLTTVLRDEWGFDGFVVSDWFALRSTGPSLKAGLSLEMPGPGRFFGEEKIVEALNDGAVEIEHLDAMATDMLVVLDRTGAFDGRGGEAEKEMDSPESRALIRRAAASGTVMLRNDGLLPLDASALTTVAVIGPNARKAKVMGGGSAAVRAYRTVSPLDAITERLGDAAEVGWAMGSDITRSVEPIPAEQLPGGATVEYFAGRAFEGDVLHTTVIDRAGLRAFGEPAPGVPSDAFSARITATLVPAVAGEHTFRLEQAGRVCVWLDGEVVIDARRGDFPRGDSFFGMGSEEITATVELEEGHSYAIRIEYTNEGAVLLAGLTLGLTAATVVDHMAEAVALAANADVAILVVGTNDDWETEGRDRDLFELPGDQPELIRKVSAANPSTVVVLNAGGPHAMDWLDAPAAVLSAGFGGQEMGGAVADVLFGDVDPGGRMPHTIPASYAHSPALPNYPGENSVVRYGEGVFIGHRWFDSREIEPAAVLGEGMSFASFDWSAPRVPSVSSLADLGPMTVEVDVTNTSDRAGSEVVQLYVEPPATPAGPVRPVRELKAFAKLHLGAGETGTAHLELTPRSFAWFDPADPFWQELSTAGPVPAGEGVVHREQAGWWVEPGTYTLVVARSARDHVHRVEVTLDGEARRVD